MHGIMHGVTINVMAVVARRLNLTIPCFCFITPYSAEESSPHKKSGSVGDGKAAVGGGKSFFFFGSS